MAENTFEVRPFLVPESHLLAKIDGVQNAIEITGDFSKPVTWVGDGAGGDAAASGALSDINCMAKQISVGTAGKAPYVILEPGMRMQITNVKETMGCFYVAIDVEDEPGSLALVTKILAEQRVSVAKIEQDERPAGSKEKATIFIATHSVKELSLTKALATFRDDQTGAIDKDSIRVFKIFEQ